MRNHWWRYSFLALLVGVASVGMSKAACGYAAALRAHWAHTRKLLTQIAAAMPEERFDFRPVKEVRSFREMLLHLVQDGTVHMGTVAGASDEEITKLEARYSNLQNRAELLKALDDFYDYGDQVLGAITDRSAMESVADLETKEKMTRVEAALVAFEDQMDHYGNFVVYLRINGIVPPVTVEAQQQHIQNQPKLDEMQK